MATDSPRTALRRASRKYEAAQAKRDLAMAELTAAVRTADEAGVPRNEIQRMTGLARATVYRLVEGPKDALRVHE